MMNLMEGDCLERLSELPKHSVDLILADPPYGTTKCTWDVVIPFERMWEELNRVITPNGAIVLMGSQPFTSLLITSNIKNFKYCWYWEKERLTNVLQVKRRAGKTVEECCVFYKKQPIYNPQRTQHTGKLRTNKIKNGTLGELLDGQQKKAVAYRDDRTRYPTQVLRVNRDSLRNRLHPTQKPVALMEHFIRTYTHPTHVVLDFCMGSGTTGVACKNTNREFIGIELDPVSFQSAKTRLMEVPKNEI